MELIAVVLLILGLLLGEIWIYQKKGRSGLSYRGSFSHTEVCQGEEITYTEVVENAKSLPLPHVKVELTVSRWLRFPEAAYAVSDQSRFVTSHFSVKGNARVTRVWQVQCNKRGVYAVDRALVAVSDLLGVVRLSFQASDTGKTITVLPRRYIEGGLILPQLVRRQYGEHLAHASLFSDPCLPAGVRAYEMGDGKNRIHWRATAHTGTLMTRLEEPVANQAITVLLALQTHPADSGQMTQDYPRIEHAISVCAECLWELARDGWTVRLCVGEMQTSGALYQIRYASGMGAYHTMLQCLAALKLEELAPMSQLLRTGMPTMPGETLLLISPYADGQVARWKYQTGGRVVVTGRAYDQVGCADLVLAPDKNN